MLDGVHSAGRERRRHASARRRSDRALVVTWSHEVGVEGCGSGGGGAGFEGDRPPAGDDSLSEDLATEHAVVRHPLAFWAEEDGDVPLTRPGAGRARSVGRRLTSTAPTLLQVEGREEAVDGGLSHPGSLVRAVASGHQRTSGALPSRYAMCPAIVTTGGRALDRLIRACPARARQGDGVGDRGACVAAKRVAAREEQALALGGVDDPGR